MIDFKNKANQFSKQIKQIEQKQRPNRVIQFFNIKRQDSLFIMGNNETKQSNSLKEWQKVDNDNGIQIYKHSKTNELAEKRVITLDPELDIKKEVKVYKMRENNIDGLVRAFGSEELSKQAESFVSCAGQNKIFVLTEKMPHRLSELPQLTFPESLLFLRESLRAYQKLYKEYGPVDVTKQLIGLNYLGEVKSWLNSNWALNHRSHQYANLRSKKVSELTREQYLAYREQYLDQPQMIKIIIAVIEQKCEDGRFPQAFKEEVISQSASFKKLLLYLKDFVEYNQIYVPEKINYEDLVHHKYSVRLEQQLSFNIQRIESQVAINQGRQGQSVQGQNAFLNLIGINQQSGLKTQQQQAKSNPPINQGSGQPFIPEPTKESPSASDMGQVTFSQSTRNYNQHSPLLIQPSVPNYQWSSNTQTLYTPSFQKPQQPPQTTSYSTTTSNQVGNYSFGPLSMTQQDDPLKSKYQGFSAETSYQGGNYSASFCGVNSNLASNGDFSYGKYQTATFGTPTIIQQSKPILTNYNFTNTYSSSNPSTNFAIGGIDSTKGYQTPSTLGYGNLQTSKWNFPGPISTTNYTTGTYSYGSTKPAEHSYNPSAFDGKNDFTSKFNGGYTGTGYSNILTKYQSEISTNPSTTFNIQAKYAQTFNDLLNTSLRGQSNDHLNQGNQNTQNNHTVTVTDTLGTSAQQKRQSSSISASNISQQNSTSEQKQMTPKNTDPLEAFAKMVERASNDVSESVLKME